MCRWEVSAGSKNHPGSQVAANRTRESTIPPQTTCTNGLYNQAVQASYPYDLKVLSTPGAGVQEAGGTWRPLPQSSSMAAFSPGDKFYVACEDDGKTYRVKLNGNETIAHCVFAERGGNSAIEDSAGNVYIASDQVYIYNSDGEQISVLEIPERPGSLAFGGPDKHTLFIEARSSLYSVRMAVPGQ